MLVIGAFTLWWAITSGLVSYHGQRQVETVKTKCGSALNVLGYITSTMPTGDWFIEHLAKYQLQLSPVPDVVVQIRVARSTILGPLLASLAFLLGPFVIELLVSVGTLPDEARSVSRILSLVSVLASAFAVVLTCSLFARLDGWAAFKEQAQVDTVKQMFRGR